MCLLLLVCLLLCLFLMVLTMCCVSTRSVFIIVLTMLGLFIILEPSLLVTLMLSSLIRHDSTHSSAMQCSYASPSDPS